MSPATRQVDRIEVRRLFVDRPVVGIVEVGLGVALATAFRVWRADVASRRRRQWNHQAVGAVGVRVIDVTDDPFNRMLRNRCAVGPLVLVERHAQDIAVTMIAGWKVPPRAANDLPLGQRAAVAISEAAQGRVDMLDAAEPVGPMRLLLAQPGQAQAATLRIGHPHQQAARIVLQAENFAGGSLNLHQLALAVEAELAAVVPGPGVLVAAGTRADRYGATRRILVAGDHRVGQVAPEDDFADIGLDDFDAIAQNRQFRFLRQTPAAPDRAWQRARTGQ